MSCHTPFEIDALMELTKRCLNMFPAKDGVSCKFSSGAVTRWPKLFHDKHPQFMFDKCAQEIYVLLRWHSFPRFKQTKEFKMLKETQAV